MLSISVNHYTSGLSQPRHAHAETTVTFVLSGVLRERVGAVEEVAHPLSIVVKPRDTEHANDFGSDVRTLQIMLPEATAAEAEHWQRDLKRWRWSHGCSAVPRFIDLLRTVRTHGGDHGQSQRVERAAYDALASLAQSDIPVRGDPPRWLSFVRESIDDSKHPASVQVLAAQAGVHPVYLARQFRRWYGCSITEHARRRRMRIAAADITTTNLSLSTIAYRTGYADQAHMCRAVARETGVTPAALRKLTAG